MNDCIFCKIVAGQFPCYKIWEDDLHLAFLSIFPNTEGFSVVIPKKHYASYVFELPQVVQAELIQASGKVAKLLDEKLEDVGRTAMICEGFGVDHAHVKLFPMHGTKGKTWEEISATCDKAHKKYFEKYEGYVSSYDCARADDWQLAELAEKIRN